MKLTEEQHKDIEYALNGFGKVRPYSGRAMYGKSCLGIVTDTPTKAILTLAMNLAEMEENELLFMLRDAEGRQDSMGHRVVLYFPSLEVDEEDEDEE
jgi:hypothetical protein